MAAAVLWVLCSGVPPASLTAQSNGGTAGAIRTYSTISSIGVEWDIVGDADHDATAAVEFRAAGTAAWRPALPLVRVDYNGSNMLAGSILFLSPKVAYEIRLTLADPDGGASTQTVAVTTRPIPAMPVSGRSFHVVPGSGGGNGSSANPFKKSAFTGNDVAATISLMCESISSSKIPPSGLPREKANPADVVASALKPRCCR